MILDKIRKDQKQARLNKDKFKTSILSTLLAEVSIVGKNAQRETTDEEAQVVIGKFLKNANEIYGLVDDKELMEAEMNIYRSYLPKQMTEEDMTAEINYFISKNPNAIMNQVMSHFSQNFKGLYDGKVLSGLVRAAI